MEKKIDIRSAERDANGNLEITADGTDFVNATRRLMRAVAAFGVLAMMHKAEADKTNEPAMLPLDHPTTNIALSALFAATKDAHEILDQMDKMAEAIADKESGHKKATTLQEGHA